MSKILVIDATGRDNRSSKTKYLSEKVIDKLQLDENEITYLDLYKENLYNLDDEILDSRITKVYSNEKTQRAQNYFDQFAKADCYIFIFPTWNWNIPAILKQYADLILISGSAFKYEKSKLVGLLKNKQAIIVNTTGGPIFPPLLATIFKVPNGVNYIKCILDIMGIKDVQKVVIPNTSTKFKNKEKNLSFDFNLYEKMVEKKVKKVKKFKQL